MENNIPLVSICIPTKNRALYLEQSIKSVLIQDYQNIEVIISDNASTDDTFQIVSGFNDKRILYNKNDKDLGLVGNLNKCISLAKGKYVCIFHDDDIMLKGNISKKIEFLEKNKNVGFVHSDIQRINEKSEVIGKHWAHKQKLESITPGKSFFELLLTDKNPVCAPSVIVRKEGYQKAGDFEEALTYSCDWNMWLRISAFFDVGYIKETLIQYRCHQDMLTEKYFRTKGVSQIYYAKIKALERVKDQVENHKNYLAQVKRYTRKRAFDLALRYFRKKSFKEAFRSFMFGAWI